MPFSAMKASHAAARLGAHRDVLQVGIRRGQLAGDDRGLRIMRVHPAGGRIDHARQLVGIGGLQLGQAAVFQQHLRQRIVLRQLGQHFSSVDGAPPASCAPPAVACGRTGSRPAAWGIQVEGLPGQFIGLLLQLQHFLAQLVALAAQLGRVHLDAVALDDGEHRRHLHFQQVDPVQPGVGLDLRPQRAMQLQREVGVLGGVVAGLVDRDLVEADLLGALPHRSSYDTPLRPR